MLAIIINPKSGKKAFRQQRLYLFRLLKQRQEPFVYKVTKYAGHATELARELVEAGHKRLLVLGGDGTLSEVIDGIMHSNIPNKQDICFGIMPRGTGNDWGRYWGIGRNYKQSLNMFFNSGIAQTVDVGCLTVYRAGEEEKHYFINSVGFGIDARTCAKAQTMKYYVGSHGLNYFFGLLSALFTHRSLPAQITTDSTFATNEPLFTMNIGNGPFSGGGIKQNPDANPTDGVFHAMFVSKPTFKLIMQALPKLFNGRLTEISFVKSFTAKQVWLNTKEHILIEKDGILVDACGPYKIEILPAALKMIVPQAI